MIARCALFRLVSRITDPCSIFAAFSIDKIAFTLVTGILVINNLIAVSNKISLRSFRSLDMCLCGVQ
jgi:hypothetical protein